ncbi:hypothetical protein AS156_25805 [Bradyrhizobium macuxiense]|uniref:Uncharacterized protein n=1 Tax=Bradyrhizobium macuxiense TaxID=1755647 RepID=A0A109K5C3_9BRAD|nr:hypothetical protein AS156_25805 [Bradyrhizobium macuxiense]
MSDYSLVGLTSQVCQLFGDAGIEPDLASNLLDGQHTKLDELLNSTLNGVGAAEITLIGDQQIRWIAVLGLEIEVIDDCMCCAGFSVGQLAKLAHDALPFELVVAGGDRAAMVVLIFSIV